MKGQNFDWTWTQHTGWRVDSKSNKDVFYLSVFDNGDARGMEQPALPEMKYSRAVVYKIDQKKMTVEQIWGIRQGTRPRLVQPGDVAHQVLRGQGFDHGLFGHCRYGTPSV